MVNQQNCDVPPVCKPFQKSDVLIVVCIQIAVISCATNALQGVDHNELGCRMLDQKLLNLLFQSVLERVGHDRKVQSRRGIFRQVKESRLDTLERIFKTEIQRFSLRCCKIPECLSLRDA